MKPKVSIGLPVFNAERYIAEVFDSIQSQTYRDFELIVSDNASSDNTESICRSYAEKDSRIRYYRNEKNLGASANFNRIFDLSSGVYFKWAADDDIIAPSFLSKCVKVLDENPSVILCFSKVKIIDQHGKFVEDFKINLNKTRSKNRCERFGNLVLLDRWCFEVFGLMRSSELRKTPLLAPHVASDRSLRAELGLRGAFYEIPEHLFLSRDHPGRSIRAYPEHYLRAEWFDPSNKGKAIFPHCRIFLEYMRCFKRVGLKLGERVRCFIYLLHWMFIDMNWAHMISDVFVAIHPNFGKLIRWIKVKRNRSAWA